MTIITKGMGAIIKGGKRIKGKLGITSKEPKRYGTIHSKLVKDKTKSKAEQTFDNVYKYSDKKEQAVRSMNEFLKKKKRKASPAMVDRYHAIMTSDPQYKLGKK